MRFNAWFVRTTLQAAAVLAVLLASQAFAAVGELRALRVVDADGKTVGRWSGESVLMSVRGKVAYVGIERVSHTDARMTWTRGGDALYFETVDCTGNGHLPSNPYSVPTGVTPSSLFMPDSGGVYLYLGLSLVARDPPPVYRSYFEDSGCKRTEYRSTFPAWVFDSVPIDLNSQFKVPLQIR